MSAELVTTLPGGLKVKRRLLRMRACDEQNDKDKFCLGHVKRWAKPDGELVARFGDELYRCERCHTIYLPNLEEIPNTRVLRF